MTNIWSRQANVQGFDCETITFKNAVNMFERMEISESIYEGVVEPYLKNLTRTYSNRAGHISKLRGEADLSTTYSNMIDTAGESRKSYADHLEGRYKIICLNHGPIHS